MWYIVRLRAKSKSRHYARLRLVYTMKTFLRFIPTKYSRCMHSVCTLCCTAWCHRVRGASEIVDIKFFGHRIWLDSLLDSHMFTMVAHMLQLRDLYQYSCLSAQPLNLWGGRHVAVHRDGRAAGTSNELRCWRRYRPDRACRHIRVSSWSMSIFSAVSLGGHGT